MRLTIGRRINLGYAIVVALLLLIAGAMYRSMTKLVEAAGASVKAPSGADDPGMLVGRHPSAADAIDDFVAAIARHRHHEREIDPPEV